ncbi:MAG: Holliday junction resolvase-like protein [Treponema sp.]
MTHAFPCKKPSYTVLNEFCRRQNLGWAVLRFIVQTPFFAAQRSPCNPADARFVGKPVDFIAFPGAADGRTVLE